MVRYFSHLLAIGITLGEFVSLAQAEEKFMQLAQIYEPSSEHQSHVYQDQYGRKVFIDDEGQIVRVEEPRHYPSGMTPPPPINLNNQGPVEGGEPYDNDPPEDPNAPPYDGRYQDDHILTRPIAPARPVVPARPILPAPPHYTQPQAQPNYTPPPTTKPSRPYMPPAQSNGVPNENTPAIEMPKMKETIAAVQVLMSRIGSSSGVIDGVTGSNFDKAAAAAGEISGKFIDPNDTNAINNALKATGGPAFTQYTITSNDINQHYAAFIPTNYALKAEMPAMAYTSPREMLAERFHIDENYLQQINPNSRFNRVGEVIKVPNLQLPQRQPVVSIVADKARKQVRGYDAAGKLIVAYPSTIGSSDTPSPSGTVSVTRIAFNPSYTYNPKINFKQAGNNSILTIPPGPNGPVGTVWIALSRPTYGIHGTPEPSRIGKTSSHGCVRLTNWDAQELAKLVRVGTTVHFTD